jgi:hypothetical protein
MAWGHTVKKAMKKDVTPSADPRARRPRSDDTPAVPKPALLLLFGAGLVGLGHRIWSARR